MIRFAQQGDYPALMKLWHECFGDGFRELLFLFERLQKPENMLVLEDRGEIAATLTLRDFSLQSGERDAKASYIYGVATLPEYQGMGHSTRLMEYAHEILAGRGYACSALVPAKQSLFEFYGKRGYETLFRINLCEVTMAGAQRLLDLKPIPPEQLEALRNRRYGGSGLFVRWDWEYLSFVVEESRFSGGDTFGFTFGGEDCCAVCTCRGKTLHVKELCAPAEAIEPLVKTLAALFQKNRILLYLCADVQTPYINNLLPFGMVRWYDKSIKPALSGRTAYIAHVLD